VLAYSERPGRVTLYDVAAGRVVARSRPGRVEAIEAASIHARGQGSAVVVGRRVVFRGAGELERPTASPDGRWLLVPWPAADQWVFVRTDGTGLRAAANVSEQFRSRSFPRVEAWCCGS
jgi:hypothetical protein